MAGLFTSNETLVCIFMETRRTFPVPFKDFGQGNNIHLPRISTLSASLRYLPTTYLFLRIYTSGILRIAHKYEHFLSFSFYTIHCQVDLINRKDMIPHVFSCNANCAITFFFTGIKDSALLQRCFMARVHNMESSRSNNTFPKIRTTIQSSKIA